jgi:hypothetical protein
LQVDLKLKAPLGSLRFGLAVVLLLVSASAWANAGKILFARGEVAIVDASGGKTTVESGTLVEEGDRIRTGDHSRVQLRLSDGALISLRSNSDYQIVAQKDEGVLEQAGKLFSGWMRSVTGAIGRTRPDQVRYETPVATIGIRGTTFELMHLPDGGRPELPAEPGTYIYLQDGALESIAGGEVRFMRPGDVVYVPLEGARRPVPAPGMKKLFARAERSRARRGKVRRAALRRRAREEREDLESTDALNDGVLTTIDPGLLLPGARGVYDTSGPQPLAARAARLALRITGDAAFVTRMVSLDTDGAVHALRATGLRPDRFGGTRLRNGQVVIWGVWEQGRYQAAIDGSAIAPSGDWHYAAGTNMLTYTNAVNLPLSGQFGFRYAGGTSLSGTLGGSLQIDRQSSGMLVDFAQNTVDVNIATAADTYAGAGSFADFYRTPSGNTLTLNGQTNTGWSGDIRGSFVGPNAEGAIADIRLDQGSTEDFYGTAAFENLGQQ